MKKFLAMLALVGVLIACNDEAATEDSTTDTTLTPSTVDTLTVPVDTINRPADTVIKK